MSDYDFEFPAAGPDAVSERAQKVLDIGAHIDSVKDPKARRLMLRTMTLLADSIQEITAPFVEPTKLATITYLGKPT